MQPPPYLILGVVCVILGVLITLGGPVPRARLGHRLWDLLVLVLFIVGVIWIRYWDDLSNFGVGLIAGLVAIVIRDIRGFMVHFQREAYGRGHRYYWYGRAHGWYRRRWNRY